LTNGVWLKNAQHANRAARRLADRLQNEAKIDIVFPVEANSVFVRMNEPSCAISMRAAGISTNSSSPMFIG